VGGPSRKGFACKKPAKHLLQDEGSVSGKGQARVVRAGVHIHVLIGVLFLMSYQVLARKYPFRRSSSEKCIDSEHVTRTAEETPIEQGANGHG